MKQLRLWCQDVLECQRSVTEAEASMKRAKTKYLEKKNSFELAKKELTEAIASELDIAQTQASE